MSEEDIKRRQAVALAYGEGTQAPRVVASGYGELAEQIIAEARRQQIFIHDAPELVGLLMGLDLDQQIPRPLYRVIAELLLWLRELEQDYANNEG
jgi:flagellar biosynthesis protein